MWQQMSCHEEWTVDRDRQTANAEEILQKRGTTSGKIKCKMSLRVFAFLQTFSAHCSEFFDIVHHTTCIWVICLTFYRKNLKLVDPLYRFCWTFCIRKKKLYRHIDICIIFFFLQFFFWSYGSFLAHKQLLLLNYSNLMVL